MSDMNMLEIGTVIKAHGIRGEVAIDYYAESPELLYGAIFLQKGHKAPEPVTVLQQRNHQGRVLIRLKNIENRTEAETLRGCKILTTKDQLPPSDNSGVYLHELIGLRVILHNTDEELGDIVAVDTSSGQELWGIVTLNGYEVLLPAVPEFVHEIDIEHGFVRITPPEGLLDLYQPETNSSRKTDQGVPFK